MSEAHVGASPVRDPAAGTGGHALHPRPAHSGEGAAGADLSPRRASTAPDTVAPDGSEVRFLLDRTHGTTRASLVEITLLAGHRSRPVRHRTVEEAWHVLEGRGRVWRRAPGDSNGTVVAVRPGDTLAIPIGWDFQFDADPDGALRFLCVTMPPWPGADEAVPVPDGGLGTPTV